MSNDTNQEPTTPAFITRLAEILAGDRPMQQSHIRAAEMICNEYGVVVDVDVDAATRATRKVCETYDPGGWAPDEKFSEWTQLIIAAYESKR